MLTLHTFFPQSPPDLVQATFDSHHGVSVAPFASLNCSFGVGDQPDKVRDNRQRIKQTLGINRLISARQVHGDQIFRVEEDGACDQELEGFDGLVTNMKGVGLMIQHADCQAILLHDPVQSVIAAVHCGWRGSVVGIIEKTVRMMSRCYQSQPADLSASISPSLGPCCSEFTNYRQELPASFLAFQHRDSYFDFWQISRAQLMTAGLQAKNIGTAEICTSCSTDFFSYRRARRQGDGITGRNCSIIAMRDNDSACIRFPRATQETDLTRAQHSNPTSTSTKNLKTLGTQSTRQLPHTNTIPAFVLRLIQGRVGNPHHL